MGFSKNSEASNFSRVLVVRILTDEKSSVTARAVKESRLPTNDASKGRKVI